MRGGIAALVKLSAIAFVAAVTSWVPVAAIFAIESRGEMPFDFLLSIFPVALLGSYAIGLPVALLTFVLSGKQLAQFPITLALISNMAGIVMIITSVVLLGEDGLYLFGIPSLIAANTFGALGYFWVIRPMRGKPNA